MLGLLLAVEVDYCLLLLLLQSLHGWLHLCCILLVLTTL